MVERKWTPGPWSYDGSVVTHKDGWMLADVWGPDAETEGANAHLIAAAPDLYEALAELITDAEVAINIPASAYAAMRKALGQA